MGSGGLSKVESSFRSYFDDGDGDGDGNDGGGGVDWCTV